MEEDILVRFPDRDAYERYWALNYVPLKYEDVKKIYEDFVKSVDGHIYLSDYEENGCVSRGDFKQNLSQEARFAFEDGLMEVFYEKNPKLYEAAFALYETAELSGRKKADQVQIFHDTFRDLYEEFLDRLFEDVLA